jgi:hypothetical protein
MSTNNPVVISIEKQECVPKNQEETILHGTAKV